MFLRITRPGDLTDLASLGLTLADSKQLLAGLQQEIVAAQARVHAVSGTGPTSWHAGMV